MDIIKINEPCHAIATAKHMPMYLRFRNHHLVKVLGKSICTADAAVTMKMNGTAQRTEIPIISDTACGSVISCCCIAMKMIIDIGIDITQNKFH